MKLPVSSIHGLLGTTLRVRTGAAVFAGMLIGGGLVALAWRHSERRRVAALPKSYERPLHAALRTWWFSAADKPPVGAVKSVLVFEDGIDVMRMAASGSPAMTMYVFDSVVITADTANLGAEPRDIVIRCHELKNRDASSIFRFRRAGKGSASFSEIICGHESPPTELLDGSMAFL